MFNGVAVLLAGLINVGGFLFFTKNMYLYSCLKSNFSMVLRSAMGSLVHHYTYLVLNYKRLRFFPLIRSFNGDTMFSTSLGIMSKFLNKGKSFLKKKAVYLLVFSLLRKVLLYSSVNNLILIINRVPKYFQEFMSIIHSPAVSVYANPFDPNSLSQEGKNSTSFDFKYVQILTCRPNGYVKIGKKGRLKRKITKRIYSSNRVID